MCWLMLRQAGACAAGCGLRLPASLMLCVPPWHAVHRFADVAFHWLQAVGAWCHFAFSHSGFSHSGARRTALPHRSDPQRIGPGMERFTAGGAAPSRSWSSTNSCQFTPQPNVGSEGVHAAAPALRSLGAGMPPVQWLDQFSAPLSIRNIAHEGMCRSGAHAEW